MPGLVRTDLLARCVPKLIHIPFSPALHRPIPGGKWKFYR